MKWHAEGKQKTNIYKQATYNLNLRCVGQKGNVPRRNRNVKRNDLPSNSASSIFSFATCPQLGAHNTDFILKHLHGTQIRVCYGCKRSIRTPPSVPPPFDFVLAAKVNYSFSHPTTENLVVKKDWKHFHFKKSSRI